MRANPVNAIAMFLPAFVATPIPIALGADSLIPRSQQRSVRGRADISVCAAEPETRLQVATDFSPFVGLARPVQDCDAARVTASADQRSEITGHTLHALGHAVFFSESEPGATIDAMANSTFVMTFDVAAPCEFTLVCNLSVQRGDDPGSALSRVIIHGPFGVVADETANAAGPTLTDQASLSLSGELQAGEHQIILIGDSRIAGITPEFTAGNAFYRLSLAAAPCLGDFDEDGEVGLSDLAALLSNFGLQRDATYEGGDIDGDDGVGLSDLAGLLGKFGRTCE